MSTIAITSLPVVTTGLVGDVIPVVQNGVTSQITNANLFGSVPNLTVLGTLVSPTVNGITVGKGAGSSSFNTAVGELALGANTSSSTNTAMGYNAMKAITTGSGNTAFGAVSLTLATTTGNNTAFGRGALFPSTGTQNTALGYNAGGDMTTGSKNTIVGSFSGNGGGLDIRTLSNYIVLSDGDANPRAYWNGADATFNGALTAVGNVLVNNSSAKIGYATGAGGTVTQLTSRTTGVTINTPVGQINTFTAAGSTTATSFIVTNSSVGSSDIIVLNQSGATNLYILAVTQIIAGSFRITFYTTGGTVSDTLTINFAVIKGAIS